MKPYAATAEAYFEAGWRGILPLPPGGKFPPPPETTGATGLDTSFADVTAWIEEKGDGNIGLRVPDGVVGIDVDSYGDKPGGVTFQNLEDTLGVLPRTLCSSSRDDGVSGIRFFRVPPGTRFVPALAGIDIIQRHHRYAVVAPSVHPSGALYEWRDSHTMQPVDDVPVIAELPNLPKAWLDHLTTLAVSPTKHNVNPTEILKGMPLGEPCEHIISAAARCFDPDEGRHDAYTAGIMSIANAGRLGCPGALQTLEALKPPFVEAIADRATADEAAGEFARMLEGALRIVAGTPQGDACPEDISWIATPEQLAAADEEQQWRMLVEQKATNLRLIEEARAANKRRALGDLPDLEIESLSDVLEQDDEEEQWLVGDMWPSGGRTLLVASAKTGKTTLLCRNLLPCLADGGMFLERFRVEPVDRKVLFLNLEVAPSTVRAWMRTAGIVDVEKIMVASLRGKVSSIELTTPEGRTRFADLLRANDIGTVILDPLAPLLAVLGLDENSNGDIAKFFGWWNEALVAGGVENDLIAHHAGHGGGRSRGASRLLDEPDAIWTMQRDEQANLRVLRAMGRDVELGDSVITFDDGTGAMGLLDGNATEIAKERLVTLQENYIMGALLGKRAVSRAGLFRDAPGVVQDTETALNGLVSRGLVIHTATGAGDYYSEAPRG